MDKIQKGDSLTQSKDLVSENIEKLKELFPEITTEGNIDFDVLKAVLGDYVETDEEYYRFTWAGKSNARREAHKPSTGTLRPAKDESVNWDKTQNLYIEGDNLEVLKLLQKSYANKVKMIYIDPPYNTGKDFVYKDNYKDNLRNYQQITGQVDADGNKLSTNSESEGRYHSNWLNMMYPRLKLARNLLKDDGVIFMSIDDNEVENLKKLGSEIFGEENYIANLAVQLNPRGRNLDKYVAKTHESVLIFSKKIDQENTMVGIEKSGDMVKEYNKEDIKGKYRLTGLRNRNQAFNPITRPNLYYPLYVDPITLKVSVTKDVNHTEETVPMTSEGVKTCWTWGKDKVNNEVELLTAEKMGDEWRIYRKDYLLGNDGKIATSLVKSLWLEKEINNDYGKKSIKSLFNKSIMDFPKSIHLITKLALTGLDTNDIVLDFFSGSATTAHAVMQLNSEDGGNRKHIQVQLPEVIDEKSEAYKAGYKTIAEIGKERIRRAGKKIIEEQKAKLIVQKEKLDKLKEDTKLFKDDEKIAALQKEIDALQSIIDNLDIGFKVFKLDSSNINAWDGNIENLEENLFDAEHNIKADRSEEDILYEILLKYGLDLTLPIEQKQIEGKTVYNVGMGALFICLANGITSKVAEGIGAWKQELQPEICRVIFKDNGFSDVEKTNSTQTLKRFGISEIKSI